MRTPTNREHTQMLAIRDQLRTALIEGAARRDRRLGTVRRPRG